MKFLKLFEGYGIELEYMIVDQSNLSVRPVSDQILKLAAGSLVSDFEDGDISWSNELVLHVIELKTSGPANTVHDLESAFSRSLGTMTKLLNGSGENLRLMPTAMHPLMNPLTEVKLWPHDNNEVYNAYDRIFGCKGHGWSNLQSMHINLPFSTDQEFEKLHTAIRFLLPVLPALSASSPIVEGKTTGSLDNRLLFYQKNQARIPSIAGAVIPEQVSSTKDYKEKILEKIYQDIAPYDPDKLMREDWLNSRGAISRFGRQTIEIRVLDIQESPSIDLAIADLICATLKILVAGVQIPLGVQQSFPTDELKQIFDATASKAENALLSNKNYLTAWNIKQSNTSARDLWEQIFERASEAMSSQHKKTITDLLKNGSLSSRILKATGAVPSHEKICEVYKQLCDCLDNNQMFKV